MRDHYNAAGESHIAPYADQVGFGAELWEAGEDAAVANDSPASASAPDAQAKPPIALH